MQCGKKDQLLVTRVTVGRQSACGLTRNKRVALATANLPIELRNEQRFFQRKEPTPRKCIFFTGRDQKGLCQDAKTLGQVPSGEVSPFQKHQFFKTTRLAKTIRGLRLEDHGARRLAQKTGIYDAALLDIVNRETSLYSNVAAKSGRKARLKNQLWP